MLLHPTRRVLVEKFDGGWIRSRRHFIGLVSDLHECVDVEEISFRENRSKDDKALRFWVYTPTHRYQVSYCSPGARGHKDNGYIGCIMSNRYYRVGEIRRRGSDLPDGVAKMSTWRHIVSNMEMVEDRHPGPRPMSAIDLPIHWFLIMKRKTSRLFNVLKHFLWGWDNRHEFDGQDI